MPTVTTDRYGWIRTFESTQLIGLNLICEIYLIFAKYLMDYLSHANAVTRHAPLSPPFEVQKSTWNRYIANFWILDPMRMQNSKINSPKGTVRRANFRYWILVKVNKPVLGYTDIRQQIVNRIRGEK